MSSPEVVKAEIFAHMAEVRAERKIAMRMAQECASRSGWSFQYDDKCGSRYLHLPAQVRDTAATQEGAISIDSGCRAISYQEICCNTALCHHAYK